MEEQPWKSQCFLQYVTTCCRRLRGCGNSWYCQRSSWKLVFAPNKFRLRVCPGSLSLVYKKKTIISTEASTCSASRSSCLPSQSNCFAGRNNTAPFVIEDVEGQRTGQDQRETDPNIPKISKGQKWSEHSLTHSKHRTVKRACLGYPLPPKQRPFRPSS